MKRLTKLANKYKTDKGTEYWYSHGFTDFYESYFEKIENPTILEIGTGDGGSAKMLNRFFDGECTIYTVDINSECAKNVEGYDNIKFINLDCSNEEIINKLFNEILTNIDFDIIIEDGSHLWDHQMISLYFLSKHLKNNGIYVLEDLHTSYFSESNPAQSPLYYLNFFNEGCGLYDYETEDLNSRIKDVIIFNRFNEKNNEFRNRSVTAIITFK